MGRSGRGWGLNGGRVLGCDRWGGGKGRGVKVEDILCTCAM